MNGLVKLYRSLQIGYSLKGLQNAKIKIADNHC